LTSRASAADHTEPGECSRRSAGTTRRVADRAMVAVRTPTFTASTHRLDRSHPRTVKCVGWYTTALPAAPTSGANCAWDAPRVGSARFRICAA